MANAKERSSELAGGDGVQGVLMVECVNFAGKIEAE